MLGPMLDGGTTPPASIHLGTTLTLDEGGTSPLLQAHPGSPVDISGRRPSLVQALASQQRLYAGSRSDISRVERYARSTSRAEEYLKRDGVTAKGLGLRPIPSRDSSPKNLNHFKVHIPSYPSILHFDEKATHASTTAMDLDFEDANSWVASPLAMESQTSLATTATLTSNLCPVSRALTLDTSLPSSATSMISCDASIQSASTAQRSDIYGWETELDRKVSTTESEDSTSTVDSLFSRERESRRLPSGGRTHLGPRFGISRAVGNAAGGLSMRNTGSVGGSGLGMGMGFRRADGKRKSLLYRVLSINGRDRREVENSLGGQKVEVPVMSGANESDVEMVMH